MNSTRSLLAESNPTAEELAPLLARAGERGAGLCPVCFAETPASYPTFPPPLAVGHGRIAGDGFAVEVGDSQWIRRLRIATPQGVRSDRRDRRAIGPRGVAAIAALPFAIAAILSALYFPRRVASPLLVTLIFAVLVLIANAVAALLWRSLPARGARAFDAAWTMLARKLVGEAGAVRFLTRLAAASLGRGKPSARSGVLAGIQEWANAPTQSGDSFLQLRAAIAVLQIDDAGRLGRDRVVGIAELVAPAFEGKEPLLFAESALAVYLGQPQPPTSGDRARLRFLLLGAAFDASLTPRDLFDLWAVAPLLKRAMAVEAAHRLGLLFGTWSTRERRKRSSFESVFQFCRSAPLLSADLCSSNGDLLLVCRSFEDLGPILVCARGIIIRGQVTANPTALVELRRPGVAGEPNFELAVGANRFALSRRPEDGLIETIRELLRHRHEDVLPYVERYLEMQSPAARDRLLRPLAAKCEECGRTCVGAAGMMGVEVV